METNTQTEKKVPQIQVTMSGPLAMYLKELGIINAEETRNHNVGESNYASHVIQPWAIWIDYQLNAFDADIIKRVLREKNEPFSSTPQSRIKDYKKIIHICEERIRQIQARTELEEYFHDNQL